MGQWIFNKRTDLTWLFLPVWMCWLVLLLLPADIRTMDSPLWVWIVFVLGIDVSHVWSTLFRTYLDREEFTKHRRLLIFAPVAGFLLALIIASISLTLFWRILAYVAVFHFVKQQYGFMRIYKAKARDFGRQRIGDNFVIYLSMIYPILFWHLNSDRAFSWFMDGDFVSFNLGPLLPVFNTVGTAIYVCLIGAWLVQELLRQRGNFPVGKLLWVLTTAVNWSLGIVFFNSDLVFTITNVVAHGMPYMALVIFYQRRKGKLTHARNRGVAYALTIIGVVLLLAFGEEYFWDQFVNRTHPQVFGAVFPYLAEAPTLPWQVLATAFLSVPQIAHYIIDGFIWKNNEKNPYLKPVLFGSA
ncbi:MAG: hypothetical protein AAGA85_01800 [Bacteroidota bacterium]